MESSNKDFLNWYQKHKQFLDSINPDIIEYKPFPSSIFIEQFYFWLYKIKSKKLQNHEQPWWVHAPTKGLTSWAEGKTELIKKEYDQWWRENYSDPFRYFDQFYDTLNDIPFDLEYYKKTFLNNNQFDFLDAERGISFKYDWFMNYIVRNSSINEIIRNCENQVRQNMGIPKIGEGWVNETSLYYFLKSTFDKTEVINHASPNFLGRQHYDIYFSEFKIAVEYQGVQHQKPVDYFGGIEAFKKNKERDERKKKLSHENNIILIEVFPDYDEKKLVNRIKRIIKKLEKT